MTTQPTDGRLFSGSPFALTASKASAACWAGRRGVRARLERLCRSYSTRPDSSLDLMWANLGAGKSHALLHLILLLGSASPTADHVAAYVEMPQQPRRFTDLYRQIINELPLGDIVPLLVGPNDNGAPPDDLRRAARTLAYGGTAEREIAKEWLAAGRPPLRDLRAATGIGARIEDDVQASEILSHIARHLATHEVRTIILIDEFQRIAASTQRQRDAILHNLRSIFSRNPAYLSVILAVTSRIETTALALLPQELRTLMGMRPTVSLPEMSEDEALEFLRERFQFFRPPGYAGPSTAPFGEECLRLIVTHVAEADRERLIPRSLLQAAAWVYDEAIALGVDEMSRADTERLLNELEWGAG
jgi:hypothetical protein